MKKVIAVGMLLLSMACVSVSHAADAPAPPEGSVTELLWPDGAPGALGDTPADKPTLTAFPLPEGQRNGTAVIVCPGGGYHGHAMGYEGYEVAQMLNKNGIVAFVLRYRVAPYRHPAPLQDAQRALRTVRSRAAQYGIDPNRIGILGFSAGGHLTASSGAHVAPADPQAADPVERVTSRPDFLVLIYPVITMRDPYTHKGSRQNLLGDQPDPALIAAMSIEEQITADSPPAFLVHSTADTGVPAENSVNYYLACRKAGVPAELHIYENGQHGFGMGKGDPILTTWPPLCIQWINKLKK